MAVQLEEEVVNLFKDNAAIKILATVDEQGTPHAVIKQTLHINDDGKLVYLEILESSRTNKHLLRSLWFNRKVSVAIHNQGISYQIIGKPVNAIISGPVFQKYYSDIRKKLGDVDLATVWVIEPEEVHNQAFSVRNEQEKAAHPIFIHLDRIAK